MINILPSHGNTNLGCLGGWVSQEVKEDLILVAWATVG